MLAFPRHNEPAQFHVGLLFAHPSWRGDDIINLERCPGALDAGTITRMTISTEGKIGIGLTLIFALGAGALTVAPTAIWIGWSIMALAAVGLLSLAIYHFRPRRPAIAAPQKTLEDLFKSDFDGLGSFLGHMILMAADRRADLPARIYFESKTNSKFASVFISFQNAWVWQIFPEHFLECMEKLERNTGAMSMITPFGDEYMHSAETVFSGRVYIYHEVPLTHSDIAALEVRLKAHGVPSPVFRGFAYQQMQNARRP